jgi:hypothetical protein
VTEELGWVRDVRWLDDDTLLLAGPSSGLVKLPLRGGAEPIVVIPSDNRGGAGIWMAHHIGASPPILAVGSVLYSMAWKNVETGETAIDVAFEGLVDMDIRDGRYLVLGLKRRGEAIAPDGAIVWLGSLSPDLPVARAVHYSVSGPGAESMERCATETLGHVRFLADGTFLVVPGGEPNAFLYEGTGELLQVWETAPLGIDVLCDIDMETAVRFGREPTTRWQWANRFTIVDEVLDLPRGPGLVLRSVIRDEPSWRLVVLQREGPPQEFAVPIEAISPWSRLRGDVRGDRIVFLRWEEWVLGPEASRGLTKPPGEQRGFFAAVPSMATAAVPETPSRDDDDSASVDKPRPGRGFRDG